VLNTLAPCPAHGFLRARHLARRTVPGLLPARHLVPACWIRIAPLPALLSPFWARIAPCSSLPAPHRSRIASCSTLGLPLRARIAPCTPPPALRCPPITRPSALSASHRSRITSCSTLGLPSRVRSAPFSLTSRPALTTDRSVFSTWRLLPVMDYSMLRSYRPHRSRITSCSTLDALMFPANCSASYT